LIARYISQKANANIKKAINVLIVMVNIKNAINVLIVMVNNS